MRPKLLTFFTFLLAASLLRAQQTHVDEVSVDTRATFHQQTTDGVYDSHFQGDHLMPFLILEYTISTVR